MTVSSVNKKIDNCFILLYNIINLQKAGNIYIKR